MPFSLDALIAIALLVLLAAVVGAGLAGPTLLRAARRARLMRRPFPAAWRDILRRRMPLYGRLPAPVQLRLKKRIQVLLAEVPFVGCDGMVITDEVRLLVAAQAALLLLERGPSFGALREVLVYPGHFVVDRERAGEGGVVHAGPQVLAGESWQRGQVVLAWDAVVDGASRPDDGHNVVIHEFAHQLDQETGAANGAPFVAWPGGRPRRRQAAARWARVMQAEFEALRQRLAGAGESAAEELIDRYAATDAAEFFACTSELFFERAHELAARHPALFAQLALCYRLDPRRW
jgi:MtfA peptidase